MNAGRSWFFASLLLNAALAAALAYSLRPQLRVVSNTAPVEEPQPAAFIEPQSSLPPASPEKFRWSRLESPDYRVYIANLRDIGCPEQTIREIIQADLADLYASKHGQPATNSPDAANVPSGAAAATQQQFQKQQTQILAQLLGPNSGGNIVPSVPDPVLTAAAMPRTPVASSLAATGESSPVISSSDPAAQANTALTTAKNTRPPTMPIAFSAVDPASLGLNQNQVAAVQKIQQNFVQAIGGPNADTSSPDYLARWQQAQPTADQMVWTLLGQQTFNAMQMTRPVRSMPQSPR